MREKFCRASFFIPHRHYIVEKIDLAIDCAKKLENYQINNNQRIGTVEANPNTEVYKIVEYLMKKG